MTYEYKLLDVAVSGRVATVTISNPPVNVITLALLAELEALSHALKADPDLTVVVFRSADPDFFILQRLDVHSSLVTHHPPAASRASRGRRRKGAPIPPG